VIRYNISSVIYSFRARAQNESGTPAKHVNLTFKWRRRQFSSIPVSEGVLEMQYFQIPYDSADVFFNLFCATSGLG
jgi:hypothetical protein